MDLFEIRAEMRRRPDAQYLIEWIESEGCEDLSAARSAIRAYFESIEES
jgi:hypothetical protein